MAGLVGSLIRWVKTLKIDSVSETVEDFTDGVVISKVLNNIDPEFFDDAWLAKIKADACINWRLKVSNLKKILKGILDYYEILGQPITGFKTPDVRAIGETNDAEELGRLLQMVLGCAVNCDHKHEYIEALRNLEENIQHDAMNAIQELMTKKIPDSYQQETYVDLSNQLKVLTEDLHATKESKEQITQHCHKLDNQVAFFLEKISKLLIENKILLERLDHIESCEDPSFIARQHIHQMQKKLELVQDELFKTEIGRDELKGEVEVQRKEITSLFQKNEELERVITQDEHDVLRYAYEKINFYESTIKSYEKKLEDMSGRVKVLEEKNEHFIKQEGAQLETKMAETQTGDSQTRQRQVTTPSNLNTQRRRRLCVLL